MVFIHGGNFMLGSGSPSFYGPDKLMDYDIILVTFNYRLGMFGKHLKFHTRRDENDPRSISLK